MKLTDAERARVDEIKAKRECVEQRADDCVRRWDETHKRHASDGSYNQDTGMWAYKEPHRVTAAMYALDAYRDAGTMVGELAQLVDDTLAIIDRLSQEPDGPNVVFCEDCVRFKDGECNSAYGLPDPVDETDYCSYGERRKEQDDG